MIELIYQIVAAPFAEFGFMRRALIACIAISVAGAPLGVVLILRRMSLMGDAISHAILPGLALSILVGGLSLWLLTLGGFVAGLIVVLGAGLLSRVTILKEDASLAAFYLTSLAIGVLAASYAGSGVDLIHLLFGSILSVDDAGLVMVASLASVTVLLLAIIYRPLLIESFDPVFLKANQGYGGWVHSVFLTLIVVNLVAGFQVLGTLMAVGLMILPASAARFWTSSVWPMMVGAMLIALASSAIGLLCSFHTDLPSGPMIVLIASLFYFGSVIVGRENGLLWQFIRGQHIHDPH